MTLKLMVIGHARHGKDTVCNILCAAYGLKFVSSSLFVAEKCVIPALAAMGVAYPDFDSAYADRVNRRAQWFDAIAAYNQGDPARLGRELFAEYDIYCGIRNRVEFQALKKEKAFDVCFWVDASLRAPPEDPSSNTMRDTDADFIINNNGDQSFLETQVRHAYEMARRWTGQ